MSGAGSIKTFDALIVGGGIHGCSAALHLANRGLTPAVVEKNWSGRHASGVNAGGVRTLLRDTAEIPLALESRRLWHGIADLITGGATDLPIEPFSVARFVAAETDSARPGRD